MKKDQHPETFGLKVRRESMKAIAFNCSTRMDKGNTAQILNPFLDGMKNERGRRRR